MKQLDDDVKSALNWFEINSLVANPSKFQMLLLGVKNYEDFGIFIKDSYIKCTNTVKLIGVTLDNKLSFRNHVEEICKKANQKTKALLRIRNHLTQDRAYLLYKTFIASAFNYSPLIWMFCGKILNSLIDNTQKRGLRAVLNDFSLPLVDLVEIFETKTLHKRNLYLLLIEVYKSINRFNPEFMADMFIPKENSYSMRHGTSFTIPKARSNMGNKAVQTKI